MSSGERRGEAAPRSGPRRSRARRVLAALVYWSAVLVVSAILVIALVLFLESRDASEVGARGGPVAAAATAAPVRTSGAPPRARAGRTPRCASRRCESGGTP